VSRSEERFRCPVFWVTEDEAEDHEGHTIHRFVVRHSGSAVIWVVDDKKRVLLVRQYRLPAAEALWELPAGRVDEGEKPLAAAKRELREETGYRARSWKKLAAFWSSPGYVAEHMTIYAASDLVAGERPAHQAEERLEARWVKLKKLDEWIRKGRVKDAKTMIGYWAYCAWGRR